MVVGDPQLGDYDTDYHVGHLRCYNPEGCSHNHQTGLTSVPPIQARCSLLPIHCCLCVVEIGPLHLNPIATRELGEGLDYFGCFAEPYHRSAHY